MSYRCVICNFPNGEADFYNEKKTSKRYFKSDPDNPNQKICLECYGEYAEALGELNLDELTRDEMYRSNEK